MINFNKKNITICVISIIVIILIIAITVYKLTTPPKYELVHPEDTNRPKYTLEEFKTEQIPKGVKESAKKYNLFKEMYYSDRKVIVYGYEKNQMEEPLNESFHTDFMKALKKEKIKNDEYNIVIYTNLEKQIIKTFKEHDIDIDEDEGCTINVPSVKDLDLLLKTSIQCYANACLVDPAKNTYQILPKDIPLLLEILNAKK